MEGELLMGGECLVHTTKNICALVPLVHSLSHQSQTKKQNKMTSQ
jgi:hypothetical protein